MIVVQGVSSVALFQQNPGFNSHNCIIYKDFGCFPRVCGDFLWVLQFPTRILKNNGRFEILYMVVASSQLVNSSLESIKFGRHLKTKFLQLLKLLNYLSSRAFFSIYPLDSQNICFSVCQYLSFAHVVYPKVLYILFQDTQGFICQIFWIHILYFIGDMHQHSLYIYHNI